MTSTEDVCHQPEKICGWNFEAFQHGRLQVSGDTNRGPPGNVSKPHQKSDVFSRRCLPLISKAQLTWVTSYTATLADGEVSTLLLKKNSQCWNNMYSVQGNDKWVHWRQLERDKQWQVETHLHLHHVQRDSRSAICEATCGVVYLRSTVHCSCGSHERRKMAQDFW